MALSAEQYNEKYSDELNQTFDDLEGYKDIEDRLGYYDSEKQITDDLVIIRNTVIDIYSSGDKVDWKLIQPLKIKLMQLQQNLEYFENAFNSKQKVSTARINQTREIVEQIGNLETKSGDKLKEKYETGGLNQMKLETINLFNKQVSKLGEIVDNIWESDNKVKDLESESIKLLQEFCSECDMYFERSKTIFNNIKSKEERLHFVLDGLSEIIENVIGPSKFRLLLGKRFDILDTIEEYSVTLYEIIEEYELKDSILGYFRNI